MGAPVRMAIAIASDVLESIDMHFLANNGLAQQIGWFYAVQGIVSLFMPSIIGIIADRWIQAQRMLSLCHLIAGIFMARRLCRKCE